MRYLPSFLVCNYPSKGFIPRLMFIFVCLEALEFVLVAVLIAAQVC